MKYLLLFLLLTTAQAGDYRPHIKIENSVDKNFRIFSGTVCETDGAQYIVVTCAHGFADLPKNKRNLTAIMISDENSVIETCTILKEDIDRDVAILSFTKRDYVNIRPIPLAEEANLPDGTECLSHGYTPEFTKRVMSVTSYSRYTGTNGDSLLLCSGHIESGMSGGALVHQGHIFGVLSTSTKHPGGLYATLSQIIAVKDKK